MKTYATLSKKRALIEYAPNVRCRQLGRKARHLTEIKRAFKELMFPADLTRNVGIALSIELVKAKYRHVCRARVCFLDRKLQKLAINSIISIHKEEVRTYGILYSSIASRTDPCMLL